MVIRGTMLYLTISSYTHWMLRILDYATVVTTISDSGKWYLHSKKIIPNSSLHTHANTNIYIRMYKILVWACLHDYSTSPQPLDTTDLFDTQIYRYYHGMCMFAFTAFKKQFHHGNTLHVYMPNLQIQKNL